MTPRRIRNGTWGAWPFPPHYVRAAWLVPLLVLPPVAFATVSFEGITFALLFSAWLAIAPSLTVATLLDWNRVPVRNKSRLRTMLRGGARLVVSFLGACGAFVGLWLTWRVVAEAWRGVVPNGALVGLAVGGGLCLVGAQLMLLPYRPVPDRRSTHG